MNLPVSPADGTSPLLGAAPPSRAMTSLRPLASTSIFLSNLASLSRIVHWERASCSFLLGTENTWRHDMASHRITLHSIEWRYMTLQDVSWRYMTLHDVTWRYMTLHDATSIYITLNRDGCHCMALHRVAWRYIALHDVTSRCMTLHRVVWRYIAMHDSI